MTVRQPAENPTVRQPAENPPRRGRPRSQKARSAILDAACELLLTLGLSSVSMDDVAQRAGVSKATIYRWWPSKETLALDALHYEWALRDTVEDTGSLRTDLVALLRPWAREVTSRPYARVIASLVTQARSDSAFAEEYVSRLVNPRRERARIVFTRALDRGEIRSGVNLEVAVDLVYGPLYHRLLHGHAPLTDRFLRDVVDQVSHGLIAPEASGRVQGSRRA